MPSLKEIKGRITSVRSTLKITSAMKMVAAAKLHRAQNAIGRMLPYEERLRGVLLHLMSEGLVTAGSDFFEQREVHKVAIIAFSSNSSLCGAFNTNAVRAVKEVISSYLEKGLTTSDITVFSVGRKMAESMSRLGYPSCEDLTHLVDKPDYESAAAFAQRVMDLYLSGACDKVELVYNHFASTSSQPTVRETYLPLVAERHDKDDDYILEPSREDIVKSLLPLSTRLKIYTVLLDTTAAEHAARTVAMQLATDNANDLLSELTLEYNKSRQQKITSEILDIVGGSMQ